MLQHTVSGVCVARATTTTLAPHGKKAGRKISTVEASRQAISMLVASRRQNGSMLGEDSSRQPHEKNMRWERIEAPWRA